MQALKDKALLVLGVLAALLGALLWWNKRKSATLEAIADNQEMHDNLVKLDTKKATNDGLLETESHKREEIKEVGEQKKESTDSDADFFKKR